MGHHFSSTKRLMPLYRDMVTKAVKKANADN